jgi:uncharacterized protein
MSIETELEERVASAVKAAISSDDSSHSIEHANEVWRLSKWLLRSTPARHRIVLAAAFCHDLKSRGEVGFSKAVDSSVEHSSPLLERLGYTNAEISLVGQCIVEGSWEYFVKGRRPTIPEAAILRDADWLEAMGAHGVARVFAFAGRYCLPIAYVDLDPDHPVRLPTPVKGPNPPFEHFYSKLLWLEENLITAEARKEGERRHAFLVHFLKEYGQEIARTSGTPQE